MSEDHDYQEKYDYLETTLETDSSGNVKATTKRRKYGDDLDDGLLIFSWIVRAFIWMWNCKVVRYGILVILCGSFIAAAIITSTTEYNLAYALLDDGTYEVCGMGNYQDEENIIIPSEYEGVPVTRVADNAFKNCESIKSVTIPNSITSIGDSAFEYCKSLISIVIPNSVTNIGESVFAWCDSLISVTLPENIKSIPTEMFYCCELLKNVNIPNGVTRIEQKAFYGCDSLTNITIPRSVNYLGERAFAYINSTVTFNYSGTKNQWDEIDKNRGGYSSWDFYTDYTIHCTDGQIAKDGTVTYN